MFGALARRMGASNRSIGRYLLASMALGFMLLLAAAVAVVALSGRNDEHTGWVIHTYQVETAIDQAQLLVEQGETTRRGYLLARQQIYLDPYREQAAQIGPAIDRIAQLTRDNPRQQRNVAEYRQRVEAIVAQRDRTIAMVKRGRAPAALTSFVAEAGAKRMRRIRDQAQVMLAEEHRLLALREAGLRHSQRAFYTVIGFAGLLLMVLALVTTLTMLRFTRDLAASRDQLARFNEALEHQVAERTADLQRANDEIQRFAYIVSHDLRSPLVNVMGFTAELEAATRPLAELVDRAEADAPALLTEDARLAAREDLPEAIGFIRTSTQKMDRLINAILKLSREGRRTIAPEHVDPAQLVDTIIGSIQHVIDDRGAVVRVERPIPAVVTDRLALEQLLSNLIENATKYLKPGRPGEIVVGGHKERNRVILSVIDNGRGIDPRDHQRVFDLFRRSGAQDQPGEGIGLAHVRALAYRLGGTIDVQSTLGDGATFRLNLPTELTIQDIKA